MSLKPEILFVIAALCILTLVLSAVIAVQFRAIPAYVFRSMISAPATQASATCAFICQYIDGQ